MDGGGIANFLPILQNPDDLLVRRDFKKMIACLKIEEGPAAAAFAGGHFEF